MASLFGFGCCEQQTGELFNLVGRPQGATQPPGMCVFGHDWKKAKLVERSQVTHNVILFTFALSDALKPLGLSTCACILAKFDDEETSEPIIRPYTPVSTNAMIGKFQLVVKIYPGGKMSNYLKDLALGESVEFKHIEKNVKIQYPFSKKHITMLVGGTGITPMIQALHAILGTAGDSTTVTMLFGNRTQSDMLCRDLLESWAKASSGRFKLVHVLSEGKNDDTWKGLTGHLSKELIMKETPPPSADHLVVVCGPPPMYSALCGPRDKPDELSGVLKEIGFTADQVFKF